MKEQALAYARFGWPVFPIRPRAKRPPLTEHGLHDATTDPEQIEAWWDKTPDANIGIATEAAGLAVVDVDDPDAELPGELTPTAVVETRPGRRQHLYAGDVGSSVGRLAPKVDTRGRGGYIVAPPSIHPDTGEPYRWLAKRKPAPVPPWVDEALQARQAPGPETVTTNGHGPTRYGRSVVDIAISQLVQADDGERNQTLFRAAVRAFELVKAGEVDGPSTAGALRRATATWLGHPADDPFTIEERERTLRSAWQKAKPTPAPAPRVNAPVAVDPRVEAFDMLDLGAMSKLPEPQWLIPGVLPEGLSLLIGRYGSLKSWVALDWSAAVAESGKRAVFFVGEDVHGFAHRVTGLAAAHGISLDNLRVVPDAPKLLREGEVSKLHKTVSDFDADLIVIDTWAMAMPGVGENDFHDLSRAVEVLRGVMSEHRCSSLVVAHTGYQDTRMRGHTSVEDAADAVWHARSDESIVGAANVECKKVKNSPQLHPLEVTLRKVNGHTVLTPSVMEFI